MKKIYPNAAAALDGLLHDGMFIAAGGFGLCGFPELLLAAIAFVLGFTRAWTRPVLGDGAFQLVRVGEAWLSGSPLTMTSGSSATALSRLSSISSHTVVSPTESMIPAKSVLSARMIM